MLRRLMISSVLMALLASAPAHAYPTTYYAAGYCGDLTASGGVLDCSAYQAAHPTLPFGTIVEVCWDACATVVVVDRGPTLDVTPAAAHAIGMVEEGIVDAPVTVL